MFYSDNAFLQNHIRDNYPGLRLFEKIFTVFARNMTFYDRTGTIVNPIRTQPVKHLAMPEFRIMTKSYKELCVDRARALMDNAIETNRKVVIMYSGGIDSTMIVIAFLMACTEQECRDNIVILMNSSSIDENRPFYQDYVMRLFDNIKHSDFFPLYIGDPQYIFLTGEGNDQLFGSMVTRKMITLYGEPSIHEPLTRTRIEGFFNNTLNNTRYSEQLTEVIWRVIDKAPESVKIDTPFLFFWWLNITCKFQSVFVRTSAYAPERNKDNVTYNDNYQMFFDTDDFQLWSLNNTNLLIEDSWKTYKQHCKDIIFEYNKDEHYRKNKVKYGSLKYVLRQKDSTVAIDENMNFYYNYPGDQILTENNSFANL
jgi:hypothetical protein